MKRFRKEPRLNERQVDPAEDDADLMWSDLYQLNYFEQREFLRGKVVHGWTGDIEIDKPNWMINGTTFKSNVWVCRFGGAKNSFVREIDFNVVLADESMLTDEKNEKILRIIKLFIVLQLHPKLLRNSEIGRVTQRDYVAKATEFVDWILMNDNVFNIGENGFSLVTIDKIKLYLIRHTSPPKSESLYESYSKLTAWLREKILTISFDDMRNAALVSPHLLDLPGIGERQLQLTDEELIMARAFIILSGNYSVQGEGIGFNAKAFTLDVYAQTLYGKLIIVPVPDELCWGIAGKREFEGVAIRNPTRPGLTDQGIRTYVSIIKRLCVVDTYEKTGLNIADLTQLNASSVRSEILAKTEERYRILPYEIAFYALEKSYEFHASVADRVFLALNSLLHNISPEIEHGASFIGGKKYMQSLEGPLYGFESFSFDHHGACQFSKIRKCTSLFETYLGLLGSCLIIVGLLAARRQEEIIKLTPKCLCPFIDPDSKDGQREEYFIDFYAGKTGSPTEAQKLKVPVPRMVARILWKFILLHQTCVDLNFINEDIPLFLANPGFGRRVLGLSSYSYNRCLDKACDFIEIPTVRCRDGVLRRFYIRQHQLRGFFASVFFWSAGFYGLDSLRAVLGHSSWAHLVRYVTMVTPGAMLKVIKAEKIFSSLVNGLSDIENLDALKDLLQQKFGVSDIFIGTSQEVYEDYSYLVEKGRVAFNVSNFSAACNPQLFNEVLVMLDNKTIELSPEFIAAHDNESGSSEQMHLVLKVHKVTN
ncbi:hypothetical protein [Pseudomonas mandelii]|uniref:hypothetical protein n=1 Tax=Pseudomonas mandelii TaxID=75612 RepID=UPI0003AA59DA|nr:hypothetical protein [Pseudomonas mandelii]